MKTTKKALALSVLSLILCVTMLLGTTYAWFTDSVKSGKNIIKSGNLDIEMYYADGTKDPASVTWADASDATIFNYELWEPGYTDVKHIKIANVGTLALKYQLAIVADGDLGILADVLDVYAFPTATQVETRDALTDTYKIGTLSEVLASASLDLSGNLMPKGSKDASGNDATYENTLTIAIKMQEEAGNEYQKLSVANGFTVVVKATQYTYEKDSFDELYDKNLILASKEVADAITNAATDGTVTEINLENDIALTSKLVVPAGAKIVLHGNGNQITSTGKLFEVIGNNSTDVLADITIDGVDFVGNGYSGNYAVCVGKHFAGNITVENCTFNNMMCGVMVDDGGNGASKITLKNNDFSGALWSYSLQKDNASRTVTYTGNKDGILGEKELFGADKPVKVVDGLYIKADGTYTITNAAGLVKFGELVNANTSFVGKEIKIANDINLAGIDWQPIHAWHDTLRDAVIDGCGHTISNMTVTKCQDFNPDTTKNNYGIGFIADAAEKITIKNLTFDKANVTDIRASKAAVVLGQAYGTAIIDKVNVTNSVVNANTKAAAILGCTGGDGHNNIQITNCKVDNFTINSDYSYALVVGMIHANESVTLTDCEVTNSSANFVNAFDGYAETITEGDYTYGKNSDGSKGFVVGVNNAWAEKRNSGTSESFLHGNGTL